MLKKIGFALAIFFAVPLAAYAQIQNPGVQRRGAITPGHAATWYNNTFIQDGGTLVNSVTAGAGITINCTGGDCTIAITPPVSVALGGTNCTVASGTCLDNITGFSGTGFPARTGAGAYSFRSVTAGTGVSVTNGDGGAGNPTIAIANQITAGSCGSATQAPAITYNAQGQLTVVTCNTIVPAFTGDISNSGNNITVVAIQGHAVQNAAPSDGQVLKWVAANSRYEPATLGTGGTVTSIAAGTGISVSPSPITSTGTITNTGVVSVATQTFCASGCTTTIAGGGTGTYTPSTGMIFAILECRGSGGGGGGANAVAGDVYGAGGGGQGSYARKRVTAAAVGASQTVSLGAAGTAGGVGSNGGAGGDSSIGTLVIGKGGGGGKFSNVSQVPVGGVGGVAGTGDLTIPGAPGGDGFYAHGSIAVYVASGRGGGEGGGVGVVDSSAVGVAGVAGTMGGGGSGGSAGNASVNGAGGVGGVGWCAATEYLSQ